MAGAEIFGLIDSSGAVATTVYLERRAPVTEEVMAMAAPWSPGQVFRFSATCQRQCIHWDERCSLADRVVELVPAWSLAMPSCQIRADCCWFSQQGREACRRCPRLITQPRKPATASAAAPATASAEERGQRAATERSEWWQRLPGSATG